MQKSKAVSKVLFLGAFILFGAIWALNSPGTIRKWN